MMERLFNTSTKTAKEYRTNIYGIESPKPKQSSANEKQKYCSTAQSQPIMQKERSSGLSLEELGKMEGFGGLTPTELEEALKFIQIITELLHTINH